MSALSLGRSRVSLAAAACWFLACLSAPPLATAAHPKSEVAYWSLSSSAAPTNLAPGAKGEIIVTASNLGDAVLNGEKAPLKVTDVLPHGLTATAISGHLAGETSATLECTPNPASEPLWCRGPVALQPSTGIKLTIAVEASAALTSPAILENEVGAEGGEIPAATAVRQRITIKAEPAPFGVEEYTLRPEAEGGLPATEAGTHPFQLTTTLALNQTGSEEPVALPKNLQFDLPPGLIGNPLAIPRCSEVNFDTIIEPGPVNLCPPDTAVGVAEVTLDEPGVFTTGPSTFTVPVFNLEPAFGEPARFGIEAFKVPVVLETAVRTGRDYSVVVTAKNTSQTAGVLASKVTIWGVPGDSRHNGSRGWECVGNRKSVPASFPKCSEQPQPPEVPFLSLPTSCETAWAAPMRAQAWTPHAEFTAPLESEFPVSLDSCDLLGFDPAINVEPEVHTASTPSGLTVGVEVPQPEAPEGRAQSTLRSTTVTLPEGLDLSPAAAGGLLACSALQIGFEGAEEQTQTFNDAFSPAAALCPDAAKIGTVAIKSPDLKNELTGSVFLAAEDTSPFEPPLVLYLVAEDPLSGVRVKLAGKVTPNPVSGQQVSVFENTPQVPFERLTLSLFGGPRASLSSPTHCGSYTTTASFAPWSGSAAATRSAAFSITSGPGGGACPPTPLPFSPSMSAGSTSARAAAFTSFALRIDKPDGQQPLNGISVHLPSGIAATLSSVTPCAEPPPGQPWSCGAASLLGKATTRSGLGGEPFSLAGEVYITTGYDGAPFGLLVETPVKAGPFDLGTVDVRSRINVDPSTAAVTITTDGGPRGEVVPTILKGVPVQLKEIDVAVDRPDFEFNPSNCSASVVSGTLRGADGGAASVSSPFQVQGCAALPFAPRLTASAGHRASKAGGANLNVTVESAGLGQANIAKVALQLPGALPSRLTTIQKACLLAVFNANPAACPEGADIGRARISTPVLRSPLEGPAYLVSHGGAAFPDIEFVLQGEGIVLILDGHTDIKKGITYSRFESAPDAPFTKFVTELPSGPHSALTAFVPAAKKYDLCGTRLVMPTTITGQNGAIIQQQTKVRVTGCHAVKSYRSSRASRRARALRKCRRVTPRGARVACERHARTRFASTRAKRTAGHRS